VIQGESDNGNSWWGVDWATDDESYAAAEAVLAQIAPPPF
jgi:hypothetical protein